MNEEERVNEYEPTVSGIVSIVLMFFVFLALLVATVYLT